MKPFTIWTRHLPICTQKRARMYDAGNCSAVYLFEKKEPYFSSLVACARMYDAGNCSAVYLFEKKEPYFSSLVAYCDNQFGIATVVGLDARAYHIDNPFFDENTGIAGKNPYLS